MLLKSRLPMILVRVHASPIGHASGFNGHASKPGHVDWWMFIPHHHIGTYQTPSDLAMSDSHRACPLPILNHNIIVQARMHGRM